ncbi:MAG: hypothetical protein J5813_06565 [Candidatus Methanomethylophilaceae archaeon]|nr:hypothetical protein [Candidatus Methanomethylophilaceae archaeon]
MTEIGTSGTFSDESLKFADSAMTLFDGGFRNDNKVVDLYDHLDGSLDASIEDISAAHLLSFIWCTLSAVNVPDMKMSADDAAEILHRNIRDAVRNSLAEIYGGD